MMDVLLVGIGLVVLLWGCCIIQTLASIFRTVAAYWMNLVKIEWMALISTQLCDFDLVNWKTSYLVAFDFPPTARVATITRAVPGDLTSTSGTPASGRLRFWGGIGHHCVCCCPSHDTLCNALQDISVI